MIFCNWELLCWVLHNSFHPLINTLRLRQKGWHFSDIFKFIFFSDTCILIQISLKVIPKCSINNIPVLVEIMAWRWWDDKPLLYPPKYEVVGGYIGFTPSVRPSVCPSVHPASRVRSVAPTVLVGSISYLYILSSNFRRCVTFIAKFQNLNFWQI